MATDGEAAAPRELGGGRYLLRRRLGAGAMGLVFLAHDRELGCDLALKLLRERSPEDLYRLKGEFRALADLRHPNLVRLHELVVDGDVSFFTMELLVGVDLLTHVRGAARVSAVGPPADGGYERLRAVLPQLLAGLDALHAAGRLHRDVKPSNIVVTAEGRAVLVDFGLASAGTPWSGRASADRTLVGTLAYMPPEQAWGERLTPAADRYALGATLHHVLTGAPPGGASALDLSARGCEEPPPSPCALVPETPADLAAVVVALRSPRPADRPDHDEIRARLGLDRALGAGPLAPSTSAVWEAPFVDREEAIAALRAALAEVRAGTPVALRVAGPSGIGKSALLGRFLKLAQAEPGVVALAGRCFLQESVPFKALDATVDALSRFLCDLAPDAVEPLMPDTSGALVRLFPVLGRVEALASRSRRGAIPSEPNELRRAAFAELRGLLQRVARRHTLVVWIDDVQWGDPDSAALLRALALGREAPPLLLVLSYRSEDGERTPLLRALDADGARGAIRRMELDALPAVDARALAAAVLDPADRAPDPAVDAIVREAGGSPFLLCELARYAAARGAPSGALALGLTAIVKERIERLDDGARRLLSAVSLAGGPCAWSTAASAAGVGRGAGEAVAALRSECLLRHSTGGPEAQLETYHDRIREAVVESLAANERRELHLRLATALEAQPGADPAQLVAHYRGAGQDVRAASAAALAAARAYDALAFERAARLYALALDILPDAPDRVRWQRGRAAALAQAGLGGESGDAYRAAARALAAERPDDAEVQAMTRLAAEQYLRSGHIAQGMTTLREVLRAVGEAFPTTPRRALLSLVLHRLRLLTRGLGYRRRAEAEIEAARLAHIDACWVAAEGLVWADVIRSADFHGRHTRLALDAGEPTRVVRALCTEAAYHAATGGRGARRRARRALAAAESLSADLAEPLAEGLTAVCAGGTAYFSGRFPEGYEHSVRAERILRTRCTGAAWELTNAHIFANWSLAHMGDVARLRAAMPELLRDARERGDRLASSCLSAGIPTSMWLLADDRPGEARAQLEAALAGWAMDDFQVPHYFALASATLISLYEGDAAVAWERLDAAWPTLRAVRLLDFQLVRCEMTQLRARAAIARASDPGLAPAERRALLRLARRAARRLAREDMLWAKPLATCLTAGVAAAEGDARAVADGLARAAAGFDAASMRLWAAAARQQAGDPAGEASMRAQGVVDPARYADALVPLRALRARPADRPTR